MTSKGTLKTRTRRKAAQQTPLVQRRRRQLEAFDISAYALPGSDTPWKDWVFEKFPHVAKKPFAKRHERLWEWFDNLEPEVKPSPRVEPWPRGGAKSSSGEMGTVWVGAKLTRRFVLYVSETQVQANKHVQAIATLFEKLGVRRAVNKYGSSKGWRGNQLRTENGFNVVALGLDTAARGIRLDNFRPDLIIFDDIDGRHDTEATIKKKIELITDTILPAGSIDCAVLFLQNLIHKRSIVSQLVDGTAPFLYNREVSTVEVAVIGLQTERYLTEAGLYAYRITGGVATWEGQDLATCEAQINEWGLPSFLRESQHEVNGEEEGIWLREWIDLTRIKDKDLPILDLIGVAVDPTGSTNGDECGIIVAGITEIAGVWHGYVLDDASLHGSPGKWAGAAVDAFKIYEADILLAEINFGGEMVAYTISTIDDAPPVQVLRVHRGKHIRAEPVARLYEEGRIHHTGMAGRFSKLEDELCGWKPNSKMKSPNRLDALVMLLDKLLISAKKRKGRFH